MGLDLPCRQCGGPIPATWHKECLTLVDQYRLNTVFALSMSFTLSLCFLQKIPSTCFEGSRRCIVACSGKRLAVPSSPFPSELAEREQSTGSSAWMLAPVAVVSAETTERDGL